MALRGDLLVIKAGTVGSDIAPAIIAESTDCSVSFSGEALETTSQTSALNASFIPGKTSSTVSGSYLLAAGGTQFATLFAYVNAGTSVEVRVERNGTTILDGQGVITSLELSGGLSDSLVTGSYSIQCSGDMSA